jgi:DNA-binding transcriptional ArsR family regulator
MLSLIQGNGNKMNVTEIYVKLRIEQSVASQHLAILRHEGLVTTERNGKIINYSVNKQAIKDLLDKCSVI